MQADRPMGVSEQNAILNSFPLAIIDSCQVFCQHLLLLRRHRGNSQSNHSLIYNMGGMLAKKLSPLLFLGVQSPLFCVLESCISQESCKLQGQFKRPPREPPDECPPVRELSHPLLFTRALALTVVLSHCEPSHT